MNTSNEADPLAREKAAHAMGLRIQFKNDVLDWTGCDPTWQPHFNYRIHPDDLPAFEAAEKREKMPESQEAIDWKARAEKAEMELANLSLDYANQDKELVALRAELESLKPDPERARFEKYASSLGYGTARTHLGEYADPKLNGMWSAWQAALAGKEGA